jgi:hypothetical protein
VPVAAVAPLCGYNASMRSSGFSTEPPLYAVALNSARMGFYKIGPFDRSA